MKAYHVHSANCNGTLNYITCSRERAMKDKCVFVQVNEIEIEDIPYNSEQHNKMLTDVQRLFDPIFNIQPKKEDQVEVLQEMLELSIKAGRRMMHDFNHMLDEIPKNNSFKEEYRERAQIWRSIFYPDNGMKNYRADLHREIEQLEFKLSQAKKKLKEHGLIEDDGLPF